MSWPVTAYLQGETRMRYKHIGAHYVLRIDKGEEIVAVLTSFCKDKGIGFGLISALGATNDAVIGLFETAAKKYHPTRIQGDHEIAHLSGNITTMKGQPYLHLHGVLSDAGYRCYGGHVTSAVVSATCEVIITLIGQEGDFKQERDFKWEVEREFDDEIGLNLLKLPPDTDEGCSKNDNCTG